MSKTILVLGAGTGGIITAKALSKKIGSNAKILLFEKEEKNVFAPSLLWLMVGKRKPKQVYRNTRKIAGAGIEVVIGNIEKVNPEQISVSVKGKKYQGDYMVISLGVEQITEHDLNNYGFDFYTLEVRKLVERKGVNYFPEHQVTSATKKTLTFDNGKTAEYDLLAFTPKHQFPAVIRETALVGKSGWIEVDRYTMATSFPNVYAIGDITFIPLEMGKPLPKAGVFGHYQAETVAHNIAQEITGKTPDKTFNGDGQCFLELRDGKAGYAGGNFYGSPLPDVKMKKPGFFWHWTKVWFEKYWFYKYF